MKDDERISRRQFLRGRFIRPNRTREDEAMRYPKDRDDVAAAGRRPLVPVLRPPGAIEEREFLNRCTRCGDCIEACPHDALVKAPARFRTAFDTPMIDPMAQPCLMCEDTPCVTACEPGVLTTTLGFAMGTAMVNEQTCLAHQGSFCSVCHEKCPAEGAFVVEAGKPRVNESACTGCGVCHYVCPAPENAVAIMPAFTRASHPSPPWTDDNA